MPTSIDKLISKGTGVAHSIDARLHGLTGVFRVLAEQHGEAGALLKRIKADPDKRTDLWPTVRQELTSHEKGELAEVYPVLRQFAETRELAEQHDREAGELSQLIEKIDQTSPSSGDWNRFFEQLVDMVEHHVEEEERDIFPRAQQVIGADRAKELEPRFLAAKKAAIAHLA
ncbi:MAG TPA: hemerythrin domain-containing protein [Kofleriaceae bacterium]